MTSFTLQQHTTGFIQKRLDYFFVSTLFQEPVNKSNMLTAFFSGHLPLPLSLELGKYENREKGFGNLPTL